VPLLEMTSAFGVLANRGERVTPTLIRRVLDGEGKVLCGPAREESPCGAGDDLARRERVVDEDDAFMITSMLADPESRLPAFRGVLDALSLDDGRPAAVKTGTTNDYRDSLTIGYTPDLVTGVWVGNADRSPMGTVPGSIGAAPIWSRFMSAAHADRPVSAFVVPEGVSPYEVCADTGTVPSEACPETRIWYFSDDRPPLGPEYDLWQRVQIIDDELAPTGAPACLVEERDFKVYPEEYRAWAESHGIAQPPSEVAALRVAEPRVEIERPRDGAVVSGFVTVTGSADLPAFESWSLWYGEGVEPPTFYGPLLGPTGSPADEERLGRIDLRGFPDGSYVLRLIARDRCGEERDARIRLIVANPTATPTTSPTPLATPTPFLTMEATIMVPTETFTPEPPKPTEPGPEPTLARRPTEPLPSATPEPTETSAAPGVTAVLPLPETATPEPYP
jgi:hypothetical protein